MTTLHLVQAMAIVRVGMIYRGQMMISGSGYSQLRIKVFLSFRCGHSTIWLIYVHFGHRSLLVVRALEQVMVDALSRLFQCFYCDLNLVIVGHYGACRRFFPFMSAISHRAPASFLTCL